MSKATRLGKAMQALVISAMYQIGRNDRYGATATHAIYNILYVIMCFTPFDPPPEKYAIEKLVFLT